MSKYIKKDENGFYVFDEIEFSKTLPTGLEYFAFDKETEQIYNLGFNYKEKMEKQISDLEAKLAEKDKEIEKLNACVDFYKSYYVSFQEKVIDELEKVKENIKKVPITDFDLSGNFEKMYKQDAIRQIDNQIKKLKGEE